MSQKHDPARPLPSATPDHELGAKLLDVERRLARIEDPDHGSRLARFQKGASFLALLVGIFLSVISLFDVFVSKPREASLHDLEEFNKTVNAVASLRQGLVQAQYQTPAPNPQMLMELNSMVTPQVLANVQYATALLPRLGENVGVPQLLVLINEAMNIYDWGSADILVQRAVSLKKSVPSMRSEAHRYKGRLMFMTGRYEDGRKAFAEALSAIGNEPGFGISGTRAYIVSDWIVSEFAFGDCSVAADQIRRFVALRNDPQLTLAARAAITGNLKSRLDQLGPKGRRCPVPSDL